jgi:hypothetical protein
VRRRFLQQLQQADFNPWIVTKEGMGSASSRVAPYPRGCGDGNKAHIEDLYMDPTKIYKTFTRFTN